MRLRSNCTSQKRTTRGALRSALAMALVAGPMVTGASDARSADTRSPAIGTQFNHPDHVEAGLLPYPFVQGGNTNFAPKGQLSRDERVKRLMHLVGLQHGSSDDSNMARTLEYRVPQVAQTAMPMIEREPMAAAVVPASASGSGSQSGTDSSGIVGKNAGCQTCPKASTANQFQAPALPAMTVGVPQTSMPAVPTSSTADSLSESLIDIEIPIDLALGNATQEESVSAQLSDPHQAHEDNLPSIRSHLSDSGSSVGLVQPTRPPQLHSLAAESIGQASSPNPKSVATTGVSGSVGRQPELLQSSKSLSLSSPAAASSAVNLSLSDSGADSDSGRPSQLHLSSASKTPTKTASAGGYLPQRAPAMQVRIEGEPAPLINVRDGHTLPAPHPSMEPAANLTSQKREEQPGRAKKINATFASRSTKLPDQEPTPPVAPAKPTTEPEGLKTGESFSVGLQESQALTTDLAIVELSVEHPAICQLMQTGESSVSLIGMRPGSTRIALITVNAEGERQVRLHQVSVGASAPTELSLPELAKELSRSVAKMVPQSDVDVVAYKDYLLVHGYTPYESDAKKIVALVRKTSLVPVVDQVKTNDR